MQLLQTRECSTSVMLEKSVKKEASKSIKVPNITEVPMECFERAPEPALRQIVNWVLPEGTNAMWAAVHMRFGEQQNDKILVNKARRLWLDSVRRFFKKEKAFYDKYHAQADKFILVPYTISKLADMIVLASGEEPPDDVIALYNDYASRKEKWAFESAKYSINKLREHNYKYLAYAKKCMEYISVFKQERELLEELHKALTFKLKIKMVYTQMYGGGEVRTIQTQSRGK
jgi:hypothetical protein